MRFASLVVLSYNRMAYLRRSLASLWANTTFPYQLIICDDASNAETARYVTDLVTSGQVSTALLNGGHNMGIGTAFNRGAAIAQGHFLVKLDADLEYAPGWLETVVRLLDEQPKLGCLGMFKYHHQPCNFEDELIADRGDHYEVVDFVGSAIAMRRQIYDEFGPWRQDEHHFSEDVSFKNKVQAAGHYLGLTHEDVITNFGFGEQHSSLIKVIDWKDGKHTYNIPDPRPLLFGSKR